MEKVVSFLKGRKTYSEIVRVFDKVERELQALVERSYVEISRLEGEKEGIEHKITVTESEKTKANRTAANIRKLMDAE